MKKVIISVLTLTLVITVLTVTSFAAYKTPADALADITGKTSKTISDLRASGSSYCAIALEAGKLDEFKAACLLIKKASLDSLVASGRLSRAAADARYARYETNQELCDGTCSAKCGDCTGTCIGTGTGGACGTNGSAQTGRGCGGTGGMRGCGR